MRDYLGLLVVNLKGIFPSDSHLFKPREECLEELRHISGLDFGDGQPPTPPGSVPPGSSGGGPIGPQLQPLAVRIKNSLRSQMRVINENATKRAEINHLRATLLKQNEEKFFQQQISHEDFTAEAKRIMSGQYDLIRSADPVVLQGQEAASFGERIAAQANDDAFKRNRAQIAWDKLQKGEALELNEVKLMREVLADQTETALRDPLYVRLSGRSATS